MNTFELIDGPVPLAIAPELQHHLNIKPFELWFEATESHNKLTNKYYFTCSDGQYRLHVTLFISS